jgi:hypothetical protein
MRLGEIVCGATIQCERNASDRSLDVREHAEALRGQASERDRLPVREGRVAWERVEIRRRDQRDTGDACAGERLFDGGVYLRTDALVARDRQTK